MLQIRRNINLIIQKMRKWMVGIYDLRGKNRQDLFFKILFHIFLFILLKLFKIQSAYPVRMQLFLYICVSLFPLFVKRDHRLIDLCKLLVRRHTGTAVYRICIRVRHIEQAAHTDHKKLVQITGKDCNKFQPFQKRYCDIPCLFQHSLVKFKPGQLPVLCEF